MYSALIGLFANHHLKWWLLTLCGVALGLGLLELLAEGIEALVVSIVKKRIGVCTVFVCGSGPFCFQHRDLKNDHSYSTIVSNG